MVYPIAYFRVNKPTEKYIQEKFWEGIKLITETCNHIPKHPPVHILFSTFDGEGNNCGFVTAHKRGKIATELYVPPNLKDDEIRQFKRTRYIV